MNDIVPTVALSEDEAALEIIDQTLLPGELRVLRIDAPDELYEAIASLRVRGAPAIGVAAAIGVYACASKQYRDTSAPDGAGAWASTQDFVKFFTALCEHIDSSRPTAVNLSWALSKMSDAAAQAARAGGDIAGILSALKDEALAIKAADEASCRAIGEYGAALLKPGMGILTHCNAGRLATAGIGTALAPIYTAHERGFELKVYCDETRPLLQGARLTAWELMDAGVDTTLICDDMAASLMASGKIDAVFVGCDRCARDGSVANKIGTLGVAILAAHYGIPFYACLPVSTVDLSCARGEDIVIEQRDIDEVTELHYEERKAPAGIKVINPAFDVTPPELITAIITDRGVYAPKTLSSCEPPHPRQRGA